MQLPPALLESVDACHHSDIHVWWASLPATDQDAINRLLYLPVEGKIHSFGAVDDDAEVLDDDGNDLYEYLVNHEHKPRGTLKGFPTFPLPCIALLSPEWPPYPTDVRYQPWTPTPSLHAQLEAEYDRARRRRGVD